MTTGLNGLNRLEADGILPENLSNTGIRIRIQQVYIVTVPQNATNCLGWTILRHFAIILRSVKPTGVLCMNRKNYPSYSMMVA